LDDNPVVAGRGEFNISGFQNKDLRWRVRGERHGPSLPSDETTAHCPLSRRGWSRSARHDLRRALIAFQDSLRRDPSYVPALLEYAPALKNAG
jgi:hypothetical protein